MRSFSDVLDVTRVDETSFRLTVDDGWQQGRGAYGGLVVGAMVRAAMLSVEDPRRRVRSVNAELLAPVPVGDARLVVEPVRVSSALSVMRVRVMPWDRAASEHGDDLYCATVLCAREREGVPAWNLAEAPAMAPLDALEPMPVLSGAMPTFTQHFEYHPTCPPPYAGADDPRAEGYVRPRDPGPRLDAAMIAALADCYWPAALAKFGAPRPIATIAYALHVHDDRLDDDARVYHHARCTHLSEGYAHETRTLWSPKGRLLATNQQIVAIIR